ncbi:MAG TPA: DUF2271 domain-containing protein [Spongiibacteraceae bacterium]|nr:DUF2271 domain-containing protein [Spongiibacteraceae bacterium]
MKLHHSIALSIPLLSTPAIAADLSVTVTLPQLEVAAYHRPYVALWLEGADQTVIANLQVWYDLKKRDNGGAKWLSDMRQWWRKGGRDLQLPVDGITGATRGAGAHVLDFSSAKAPLDKLPAGEYQLVVEAAREAGGREVVRVPFNWSPGASQSEPVTVNGKEEIASVSLQIK